MLRRLCGLLVRAGSASDRDGLPVASALLLVGVVAPCPGAGCSQVWPTPELVGSRGSACNSGL